MKALSVVTAGPRPVNPRTPNPAIALSRLATRRGRLAQSVHEAAWSDIHWYECHGIGKVKMKVKRWL